MSDGMMWAVLGIGVGCLSLLVGISQVLRVMCDRLGEIRDGVERRDWHGVPPRGG